MLRAMLWLLGWPVAASLSAAEPGTAGGAKENQGRDGARPSSEAASATSAGWVKHEGNPVLGGKLGTCFDVAVLKEGDTYRMWFSWRPKKSVALVESQDGIHWGEPLIVLGPLQATGWEDDINRPVVLRREDGYHLWYTGQARGRSAIGYATSADGKVWRRQSAQPVLRADKPWEKVAVMCPHVLWDPANRSFRMWYSGGEQYEPDAIGYATSPDGLAWTKHEGNPVFAADPKLEWERHKVTACQVIKQEDWHLMFYIGFRDLNHAQIGLARSRDGLTRWERHPANPLIRPGVNQWDHDACYKPYALFDGSQWRLWYNGRRGAVEQIGLALHPGADLGFPASPAVLKPDTLKRYVEEFNRNDQELYPQYVTNGAAGAFLEHNAPLFECPDQELERTYYFRWWTYRKHIKSTPEGFVITEFLPPVPWAGKLNTISCPAGHHFYEGRWLREPRFLDDYSVFWFRKGGEPRRYSFWAADALWARHLASPNRALVTGLLPDLVANFEAWEKTRRDPNGLFWQVDDRDGMEVSIGGSGYRATINSYMFGDAVAIANIAELAGQPVVATRFRNEAARLKQLVLEKLWDDQAQFFKVAPRQDALTPKSAGILEWRVNNDPELAKTARPSASHCNPQDTVNALNDGREPKASGDSSIPRLTFWDHQGTTEWVQYDFPAPIEARSVQVYWFQDSAGCRLPKEWRLFYHHGDQWQPVQNQERYRVSANGYNQLAFTAVKTTGLRMEVVCQGGRQPAEQDKLSLVEVRELHGFTPWYFHLPEARQAAAWHQLMAPGGFRAPFGPTTAEQRHPKFTVAYAGHECQWNGPSWPYATAVTLTALANHLNDFPGTSLTARDYLDTLRTYALSHRRKRDDGRVVPWIDENLNPQTGDWISRTLLIQRKRAPLERGKDYNHSSFCDLVISGLVGLRPRPDDLVEVNPLVPEGAWDWFCLDRVSYHNHDLTIFWDKTGARYGKGAGLRVWADGREIAAAPKLGRLTGKLP